MATYPYSGRLTDFGEAPFPTASPKLWVEATEPAFGPTGVLSTRRIPVTVASSGNFSVDLVPTVDTSPTVYYKLRLEWLHVDGNLAGWNEWQFTAVKGGGAIKDMVSAPASVWFVGPPWPTVPLPSGFYLDRFTNDVGRKE